MYSMLSSGNKKLRQIVIDEKNYQALRMLGNTPESFNDILTKLLQNGPGFRGPGQSVATAQQSKGGITTNG